MGYKSVESWLSGDTPISDLEPIPPLPAEELTKFPADTLEKNVHRSLIAYLQAEYGWTWFHQLDTNKELQKDIAASSECVWRALEEDWWEWCMGSHLFFW
jgi:hypothetical protein